VTKIADPHSLALHEALMIEGGWDQYSDKELASYLSSSSFTPARLRDQLASGELVLLKEIPAVPVFRLVSGSIVPAESASIAIAENAVNAFGKRFGDRPAFPARGTAYAHSDSLPPPPKLDYTPEPPVIEPPPEPLPPPVVISENFGLSPLGPKVFAKSCTRPSGDTDSNEGQEKASNFGTLAMLAPATVTSPGANGLRPLGLTSGSAMRLTKGWAMAARIGASVLSTAASTVLLALWPSKLGDSTLYTEEELREMAEAAIRVRFHLHVDATGNLRVAGYHVNDSTGYKDRVPVAQAELVGENFEVVVDDDFTLVWYPDDSGHRPVVSTEYPADSGIDPYSILVTPIQEDGQEHSPPGYQRPFEDQVELIVSFPADSGIEPLYLVFQKRAGREVENVSDTLATAQRIAELDKMGHAPVRHGGPDWVTDIQLEERAVKGIDPVSGTVFDAFNKFPDGSPKLHKVGRHATAFTTDQALLQAEDFARKSVQFQENVAAARANGDLFVDPVELPLVDVFGSDYKSYVRGVSRLGSKQAPTGQVSTDFSGGTLKAIYRLDHSGRVSLHTLYPNPKIKP